MKSPTPEAQCTQGVFQIQSPICDVSHNGQEKFSDLHCSNYWKMHLWSFPPFLHDLIIRPHVKQYPHKFAQKSLFLHEKLF